MTGAGDDLRGHLKGRPWLVIGVILAVAATLVLVLSNDARWLRIGIVAALWAALVGAFFAARYRKHAVTTEESVAQAQAVYELELEREIAARREFELEVEVEARDRVEADSREELDALRAELAALRESLQSLLGGEVLYERVALTAQATRMRALKEQRVVQAGAGVRSSPSPAPQLVAGQSAASQPQSEPRESPTELIERVVTPSPSASQSSGQPPVSPSPSSRSSARPEEVDALEATSISVPQRDKLGRDPERASDVIPRAAAVAEVAAQATRATDQIRKPSPTPVFSAASSPPNSVSDHFPKPVAAPSRSSMPPIPPATPNRRPEPAPPARAAGWDRSGKPATNPVAEPVAGRRAQVADSPTEIVRAARKSNLGESESIDSTNLIDSPVATPAAENQQLSQPQGQSGGRRRRADDSTGPAVVPVSHGGGRRRRPDGEPPSWQDSDSREPNGSKHSTAGSGFFTPNQVEAQAQAERNRNGHSRHESGAAQNESKPANGHGSHTAGRSVSELLAAHGGGEPNPRRRRRTED